MKFSVTDINISKLAVSILTTLLIINNDLHWFYGTIILVLTSFDILYYLR